MGQTATLYGVDAACFQRLVDAPESVDMEREAQADAGFNKTQMGLGYVLAKDRDRATADMVVGIFEPPQFLGADFEWDEIDADEALELEAARIHYNDPAAVQTIADFLATVSEDDVRAAFDPEDMNRLKVYPNGAWNRSPDPRYLYNEADILEEFRKLKQFFGQISQAGLYCLSFVG